MEFIIKTDFSKLPSVIEYNHDELKHQLAQKLEKYNNIVITDDDIPNAKADRASLNKLKNALETKRREVKKECLRPYEAFEKDIKEIAAMVDEPAKAIDAQIKGFESRKKDEKKKEIEKIYNEYAGEMKGIITLNNIWNPRWLNATFSIADISFEIEAALNKVNSGIQIIKSLGSDFEGQILDKFLQTLDINAAFMENKRLEEQRARMEELEKKSLAQSEPAAYKIQEPAAQGVSSCKTKPINQANTVGPETCAGQPLFRLDFRVFVTAEQAELLKSFLLENNIKFGRTPQAV